MLGALRTVAILSFVAMLALPQIGRRRSSSPEAAGFPEKAEFYFLRLEYKDAPFARRMWGGRGWWMQDMPEAEMHFSQGIQRLTRIDIGECRHTGLHDDRVYDYPWIYATQVGWWDLSDAEVKRLREYLLRGGFLVVDDFHGERDWAFFQDSMSRVLPGYPIVDIEDGDSIMNVVFQITERTFIPGLRHLRRGQGGATYVQPTAIPPTWRAIYDAKGRMLVAINFNMDIGDAWEHADLPEYPEQMTSLSYRFGINYIVYSMTH